MRWWLRHGRTDQRAQVGCAKGALSLGQLHGRQQFGCAAAFVQGIHCQHFGAEACALSPTELAHVLLSYGTQAQQCLAVQHHLATRLAFEHWREVGRVHDAAVCSVWRSGMFSQQLRVAPDDDALAVDAHGDRRADVLDGYRIAIAENGHQRTTAHPAWLGEAIVGGRGWQWIAFGDLLAQPRQRRHVGGL